MAGMMMESPLLLRRGGIIVALRAQKQRISDSQTNRFVEVGSVAPDEKTKPKITSLGPSIGEV
jgi:hypothetical protein